MSARDRHRRRKLGLVHKDNFKPGHIVTTSMGPHAICDGPCKGWMVSDRFPIQITEGQFLALLNESRSQEDANCPIVDGCAYVVTQLVDADDLVGAIVVIYRRGSVHWISQIRRHLPFIDLLEG